MGTSADDPISLRPLCDVAGRADRFEATGAEPWLEIVVPRLRSLAGQYVEVTYRTCFWDAPVRPIFRFRLKDGSHTDRIAAGPVAGAAIWSGRVPEETSRIEVSPTNRLGPFGFRIERLRPTSWIALMARGLNHQPRRARSVLLTRLIGWRAEADVNLCWATGAIPLANFSDWRSQRTRDLAPRDLDAPRFDWRRSAPPIEVAIGDGDQALVSRSLKSLEAQIFPYWVVRVPTDVGSADPRIQACRGDGTQDCEPGGKLTCRIEAGDRLAPGALATIAEQAHRNPSCRLLYADALLKGAGGGPAVAFHPGWSPKLFAALPPKNALIVLRDLAHWPRAVRLQFIDEGWFPALSHLVGGEVHALHRILVEKSSAAEPMPPVAPIPVRRAKISIIIPTRDQPGRLRRLVKSIHANAPHGAPQIVIVDNGSTSDAARGLLSELGKRLDVVCLFDPGPFNFSQMCNDGAAGADGDVLVFLNDDTQVLTSDWLDRLSAHALDPTIGAVGAKLTYPDGRLQHVGVLLGMGGSAGHFGALAAADDPGWARRNTVPHEVSAVTGACLAVARSKFEAVGGFDAEHLPVELSDVDLCLRLNARGWQTMVDPIVHLMHEESASRGGATFRRLDVYAEQRAVFLERWRHVLRDDPFFHPGLSLYSFAPALA